MTFFVYIWLFLAMQLFLYTTYGIFYLQFASLVTLCIMWLRVWVINRLIYYLSYLVVLEQIDGRPTALISMTGRANGKWRPSRVPLKTTSGVLHFCTSDNAAELNWKEPNLNLHTEFCLQMSGQTDKHEEILYITKYDLYNVCIFFLFFL